MVEINYKIFICLFLSTSIFASDNIEDYNITYAKTPEKSSIQKNKEAIKNMSKEEFIQYIDLHKQNEEMMNESKGQIGQKNTVLKNNIENKLKK